jgi:hypothetical protein
VNLDLTESRQIGITFRGSKTRVFSWNWHGKEREGPAYSQIGATHDEHGYTINHFLAPGQEAVYRVE